MKCFVVLSVCFVFVSQAAGQGYGRQRTRPNPVIHPTGVIHDQPDHRHAIHNPIHSPIRGGNAGMPAEVLAVIGSTITGEEIDFRHDNFPVHGGTRDPTGRTPQGWGQDPTEPLTTDVSSWNDPMRGAQFPVDFQGEPLILNEDRNRWEREHQQAKATNYVQIDSNHLMPGHGHQRHVENKIVEQQVHISAKQNHNAVKSSVIQAGRPSHIGSGHGISTHQAPNVQHNIVKSSIGGVDHISGTASVFQENPVHRVHKVTKSGVAAVGHDRFATNLGTAIAKEIISQSSSIVDFGSNGGVSSGNQIATAAALGLAKEASHIVGDIINTASQSNIRHGHNTVGSIHPIPTHPKPVHPKPFYPKSLHPKPVHHKPTHPKPTHTNLVHHTSVHHSSVHPKPVAHSKPFYPKSRHPKPVHPKPIHPKPTHTNLVHHTSVHHSSRHPKPVHPKPVHPKPFYPKSRHPEPNHPKPVHPKPTHTNLVHHTSVHHSSVHPKPFYPRSLHPKPTHPKPTHTNVVHHTSVHHSSVHPKPVAHSKPFYPKSRHPKPVKPTHPKPTHTNLVHHTSVHHSPVHHSSVSHSSTHPKPVHPKPAYPKTVVKKPKLNTGYGRRH